MATIGSVKIIGNGLDTVLEVDGKQVFNCTGFTVRGYGPDQLTKLILELDVDEVEIEGNFEVETRPSD